MFTWARLATAGLAVITLGVAVSPALAATREVEVGSFFFEDATRGDGEITVARGDQITFRFQRGQGNHTAQVDGQFDSGNKEAGESFTTGPLLMAGEFTLYCTYHRGSGHVAKLVVTASGPTASATPRPPKPSPTARATPPPARTSAPRPRSTPRSTPAAAATRSAAAGAPASRQPRPRVTTAPPRTTVAAPRATALPVLPSAAQEDRSNGLRLAAFVVLGLIPISLVAAWYVRRGRPPRQR